MRLLTLFVSSAAPAAWAEEASKAAAEPVSLASSLATITLGLLVVIGFIFAAAWLVKRFSGLQTPGNQQMKVVAALPLGTRERLAVVQVGDKQLLIGVTTQQITFLHKFDEPVIEGSVDSDFARKLQNILQRKQPES